MSDILDRLRGYNPPDRTIDAQRQIAVDIHEAAAEIERLRAALAAEPHDWREAVDDMLSVQHEVASHNPRESINRLINWHVAVALDPLVSSDAAALVESGRQAALAAEPTTTAPRDPFTAGISYPPDTRPP